MLVRNTLYWLAWPYLSEKFIGLLRIWTKSSKSTFLIALSLLNFMRHLYAKPIQMQSQNHLIN